MLISDRSAHFQSQSSHITTLIGRSCNDSELSVPQSAPKIMKVFLSKKSSRQRQQKRKKEQV